MRAVHADWSVDPRKRWMAIANPAGAGWRLDAPEPVGDVTTLFARLQDGVRTVALGVDLPLGLPRAFVARHCDQHGFVAFLHDLTRHPGFFEVCADLSDLSSSRPFYPMRGVKGMTRVSHATALGLLHADDLSRDCDRATAERPAGCPLFWTLGANQTGKAAIAAWRDLLLPAIATAHVPRLWPFEGDFLKMLDRGGIVIAETYPAEALRQLGLCLHGSKRRQSDRIALAPALLDVVDRLAITPSPAFLAALSQGFGADAAGEDRLDCVLGVLAVINVLAGHRPDGVPDDPWLRYWEGWVLGQTARPQPRQTNLSPYSFPPTYRGQDDAGTGSGFSG
ncbi:MAG: DUF429 domain-containing protein [Acetobacteraceae bacterium]|nr:DUF429 domain-containing protein [Acetobacteraceae bacterium]